jgi:tetratricopeptide (TPR) repeat protein
LEALTHYNFVASKPNNNYYTEVLRYAGNISYDLKDYNQALGHYSTLEKVAVSDEDLKISIVGQLRAFWNLNNFTSTVEYSIKTTSIIDIEEHIFVEAMLCKGVSLKELQQFDLALSVLDSTTNLTKGVEAAQAKYYKCEILYAQGNFELCENEIMELVQQKPSYDYWLAKGIILLGDNFVALGDYFNAKHSLQSIVDNYSGESKAELVKIAQEKIDTIIALENAEEQQFDTQEVEIDFENTDPKDSELFEQEGDQDSENDNPIEDSNTDDNEE